MSAPAPTPARETRPAPAPPATQARSAADVASSAGADAPDPALPPGPPGEGASATPPAGPRRSLLSKIILGVSLAVLLVQGIAIAGVLYAYQRELAATRRASAENLARILGAGRDERSLLEAGAVVYDADMRRVAGLAPGDEAPELRDTLAEALLGARRERKTTLVERGSHAFYAVPLETGDFVVIHAPPEPELVPGRIATYFVAATGLVVVVILITGASTIHAVYRHILKPVSALTAANRALVTRDEPGALVPEEDIPHDELGDAIRSRNEIYTRMIAFQRSLRAQTDLLRRQRDELDRQRRVLAAQNTELLRWRRELERRVQETRKELEATYGRLAESEKLAAAGRLAAGIAHEINNPLASIAGYAEDLLQLAKDPLLAALDEFKEFPESLEVIQEQAFRCKKIIRELLTFAKPAAFAPEPLETARVVENVLRLVEHKARGRAVTIALDEAPSTPRALADETHLKQVLVNLIENAFDAIEGTTGEIRIATRAERRPAPPASEGAQAPVPPPMTVIEVRDSGLGIAPENMGKIFEPFFTTKPTGRGTGLGLSICHSIVSRMGGRIEVESERGKGTTFRVVLPAV